MFYNLKFFSITVFFTKMKSEEKNESKESFSAIFKYITVKIVYNFVWQTSDNLINFFFFFTKNKT